MRHQRRSLASNALRTVLVLAPLLALAACALNPTTRMGMVKDEQTGMLYGSQIEAVMITEPSFYANRKIKVRVRNTSGDTAFDLKGFTSEIEKAYAEKGYEPTQDEDFGLVLDVNVRYSGHIQRSLSADYAFLGSTLGTTAGVVSDRSYTTIVGSTVAGATLGAVVGTYTTEDTYIVISDISFGVVKSAKVSGKRVTFSRSEKLKDIDDPDEETKIIQRGFKRIHHTGVAVYGGGINVKQSDIVEEVQARTVRIVSDFL